MIHMKLDQQQRQSLEELFGKLNLSFTKEEAKMFKGGMMARIQSILEDEFSLLLSPGVFLKVPSEFFISIIVEAKHPKISDEELLQLVHQKLLAETRISA